jgi:hypothetical protein
MSSQKSTVYAVEQHRERDAAEVRAREARERDELATAEASQAT